MAGKPGVSSFCFARIPSQPKVRGKSAKRETSTHDEVHSASRSAYVRAQQRLCAHNKDCESCQIVASTSTDKKGMIVVRISVSTQGAWCFSFARTPVSTWGAFWFFFCVSLCAPPSQPGVRSFCFCAHLRLNLGCVVFVFVRTPVSTWGAFCFLFFLLCVLVRTSVSTWGA